MISRTSESTTFASFKASTLSQKLAVIHFLKSKTLSYTLSLVKKSKLSLEWCNQVEKVKNVLPMEGTGVRELQ